MTWLPASHRASNPKSSRDRKKKACPRRKSGPFYNLVLEVTFHYFCHKSFTRSKSVSPVHYKGRGLHTGVWISGGGDPWDPTTIHFFFLLAFLDKHISFPRSTCYWGNKEIKWLKAIQLKVLIRKVTTPWSFLSKSRFINDLPGHILDHVRASLVVQMVKNLPAMQET